MMKPLYEISSQYEKLMNDIMQCDEINQEQLSSITLIEDNIKDKSINVAAFIKNLESESDCIDKVISSMEERQRKVISKINFLTTYLKENLEKCNINEVKSSMFDIKIKLNPASVVVQDEKIIPSHYFKEMIMKRLDKTMISNELKNNIMIPGVSLERRTRIEIK